MTKDVVGLFKLDDGSIVNKYQEMEVFLNMFFSSVFTKENKNAAKSNRRIYYITFR